jgi:hypothetical protein
MQEGVVLSGFAWYDQQTAFYETASTSTDLCEHCHITNETLMHKRELGAGAHAEFTCTTCHDPHSTQASCDACHVEDLQAAPIPIDSSVCYHCHQPHGESFDCLYCHQPADLHLTDNGAPFIFSRLLITHSQVHQRVTCVACHDASGLEVVYDPDSDSWRTIRSTFLLGKVVTANYQSHQLQGQVDCSRCHNDDNIWDLPVYAGDEGVP